MGAHANDGRTSGRRSNPRRRVGGATGVGARPVRRARPAAAGDRVLHPAGRTATHGRGLMGESLLSGLGAALVDGSLTDERLLADTGRSPVIEILPDANVIKVGGQSFIDRGRTAVFPFLEELVANLPDHKMIIGTGAGTRARHAYSVGIDLGMPTGVLSVLGTFVSMQNARMLHYLLARHGIPFIEPVQFPQLPLYLEERGAVIFFGMPPYTFWQRNP